MELSGIIGIVGSIASIGGAIYAYLQAVDAKKYANKSEQVKNQLLGHKDIRELTEIHIECKRVASAMIKYGAGSTPHSLTGVKPEVESIEVQKLIVSIRENRSLFDAETSVADEFCEKATDSLTCFANSTTPAELREHGSSLLKLINTLTGLVKEILDVKNSITI